MSFNSHHNLVSAGVGREGYTSAGMGEEEHVA